jgi:hypothetical protein
MSEPFFRGGGFEVSGNLLRTPRRTYTLDRIEYVSVTRPLIPFAGLPALGIVGFVAVFHRYLFAGEIALMLAASLASIAIACLFGTLRVHSLALRDDEVAQSLGPITRLRQVRAAVEQAMERRSREEVSE